MTVPTLITAILSGTFLAAIVTAGTSAIVTTWIARQKSREEERSRVRTIYAEAFQVVGAYKELPYAIRRRRHDQPEAERFRLSEEARKIQERLSYYRAWTQGESKTVGRAYLNLVTELRRAAGGACRQAWIDEPCKTDADMNIGTELVDLSALGPLEDAYAAAVDAELAQRKPSK
jgi:hypothetical protein